MYKVDCNRLEKQESKKRTKENPYNTKTVRIKENNTHTHRLYEKYITDR